ncbi:unnamed protein product [Heligmosomoides polygyrus]|uniref:MARVEL domain-containing protein n=1 Tax=Heligmosomoides polygyrus TaxID=6339 RepID=A0A183F350_HELPZ|nr:unnamed protein product [Heligmosomoides polygyrus]
MRGVSHRAIKGSRLVAILLNVFIATNIIFSFTRSSTVAVYTLMTSAFAVVIFGSLLYGVYKEKRLYLVPYLVFQLISIGVTVIVLFSFIIAIALNSNMVTDLAKDIGNVDLHRPQQQLDRAITTFTVLLIVSLCVSGFVQAYFFEVRPFYLLTLTKICNTDHNSDP